MDKKEEIKLDKSKKETLDLKEFMLLDEKKQYQKIEDTLNKMYENKVKVSKKYEEKILNICFNQNDTDTYLPKNLMVSKIGSKLIFEFRKKSNIIVIVILLLLVFFAIGLSTYFGVNYAFAKKFNIDLNGDGIPDLNIDTNNDNVCDINCDNNKDKIPDINIDYKGNHKPTFNVLLDDGTLFNKLNIDLDNDGICDINCDIDSDGFPDLNIDIDGDGVADFDIDTNKDKIKDMNLDTNGDMVCDINCDDNKDGICDRNCIIITDAKDDASSNPENPHKEEDNQDTNTDNPTISEEGNGDINHESASLKVNFESLNKVDIKNLFPDDQNDSNLNTTVPDLIFTIENSSSIPIKYDLNWIVKENTYESTNFWYKVTSTNGGYNCDYVTAPKSDSLIKDSITILPNTIHKYNISFTLHGTGSLQNYDQGKIFDGQIEVTLSSK